MSNHDCTDFAIFALLGYDALSTNDKDDKPYNWRHVVYSGFNDAFREFFPGEDPKARLDELSREGLIKLNIAKGGAVFKPEPALLRKLSPAEKTKAEGVRMHLEAFVAKRAEKRMAPRSKRKPVEEQAEALWNEGKRDEALKLLGYR